MTGPLVSVREVADAWGVTVRCAKRRLLRLDARLRRAGIALLHQDGEGGPYWVDARVLQGDSASVRFCTSADNLRNIEACADSPPTSERSSRPSSRIGLDE